jgi:hypothetical protein
MRLRPIIGVGKDSRANRVDSTVLAASTTAQVGEMGKKRCWPLTKTSICVTRLSEVCRQATWARGTRKSRRAASLKPDLAPESRKALIRIGALLYLSKLERLGSGGSPWTAKGGVVHFVQVVHSGSKAMM